MNAPSSRRHAALLGAAALGMALVAGACSGSGTGPARASLSADESRALAATMDTENNTVVGDQTGRLDTSAGLAPLSDQNGSMPGPRATVLSSQTTFHTKRDCRLGGTMTVDGDISHSFDTSTNTLTADFQATVTHDGCVRDIRGTDITLTGNPNLQLAAHRERVDGAPSGQQTWSLKGSVSWTKPDGTSGTCDIDIQGTLDPATHTRTIDGSVCGNTIHESLTWNGGNG